MPEIFVVGPEEVAQVDPEDAQDGVGRGRRKGPFAAQGVMDVRLRDPGQMRQAAFGDLTAADAIAHMLEKPPFQFLKVHPAGLFLRAIG